MKPRPIYPILISLLFTSLIVFPPNQIGGVAQTTPDWRGQIAYLGSDGNIWVQSSEATQPFQVTTDADEKLRYYAPQFSPGGDLLAYCRNDQAGEGGSDLYLVRTGAWQPIFLVADVYCLGYPQRGFDWSSDGSSIAYSRSFEYNPQPDGRQWSIYHGIWSVDIVSGEAEELVPPPGTNPLVYPLWSPDGRWIRMYELVFQEGLGVLRTWNQESGALYNWLGLGGDLFPGFSDWSPDSSRLVLDQVTYVGYPGAGLYTSSPDVSGLQPIVIDPGRGAVQPLWSPDGATLAFQMLTYYRNEQTSLMFSAPDGGNLREAFTNQASMVLLDWSPEGDQLLLVTDDGGQAGLYIYDLPSKGAITIALPSGWQADWSVLPEGSGFGTSSKPVEIADFKASGGSLLTYLAENYQLWLFDPSNGSQAAISPPLSAAMFWVSPSGELLIYSDRLLKLEYQSGGTVSIQQSTLPNVPNADEITWAPDEMRFSYRDSNSRIWLVDSGGSFVEIPGASDLPDWSADGRFLSYCTDGEKLWVVGGGISLREVASAVDCDVQWSSSQPLLAYTQKGNAGADSDQVYVYNAERGESSLALDSTKLVGWSPDGNVLAMKRVGKFGGRDYTFYVLDPLRDRLLEVGNHTTTDPGLQGWGKSTEEYILGPYRIDADLTSSDLVSSTLYDVTQNGQVLLIGNQADSVHELICLDIAVGQPSTLLEANLRGVPTAQKPGIWAHLSPGGNWASSYHYDSGDYKYLLTRCDRQRQANLEASEDPFGDGFSGDSRWYMQRLPGDNRSGQLLLYDLQSLDRVSIPALSGAPATWIRPPEGVISNSFSLSGQITGNNEEPEAAVNILVDGQPAATSDQDGYFELTGLVAGEHIITALKGELVFMPESHTITLPDETGGIVFTVQSVPPNQDTSDVDDKQVTQPAASTDSGTPVEGEVINESGSNSNNTADNVWLWGGGILLVVFLLVILIFRIIRRRRESQQLDSETSTDESLPPTSKAMQSQVSSQLKQGVEKVKAGQNDEGLQLLEDVLKQDPDNAIAWLWSGMAATRMRKWSAAERSFKKAQKLDHPKADEALEWLEEQRSKG